MCRVYNYIIEKTRAILLRRGPGEEMRGLLRTADILLVGEIYQNLPEEDREFFLRPSKIKDIARLPRADIVITDGALSARQARNIMGESGTEVVDRTSLVLHIFAREARSRSSRLQIEAAQLEHLRGRLRDRWPHLQREGAGIGTRGPGETQLETDKRQIEGRLRWLRREIRQHERSRDRNLLRRREGGLLRVSLWGYTNSGKSTIFHLLGAEGARPSPKLFSTLDSQTRRVQLRTHTFLLTDTVGIISDMPPSLLDAFHSSLEEVGESDLLLHVVSGADPQGDLRLGNALLERLGFDHIPQIIVHNRPETRPLGVRIEEDPAALRRALEDDFRRRSRSVELLFPYSSGSALHHLYEHTHLLRRRDLPDGVHVSARILPDRLHLWQSFAT